MVCWHLKCSSLHSSGLLTLNSALNVKTLLLGQMLSFLTKISKYRHTQCLPCSQRQSVPQKYEVNILFACSHCSIDCQLLNHRICIQSVSGLGIK